MKRAARGAPHLYYPNVRFSVRIMPPDVSFLNDIVGIVPCPEHPVIQTKETLPVSIELL